MKSRGQPMWVERTIEPRGKARDERCQISCNNRRFDRTCQIVADDIKIDRFRRCGRDIGRLPKTTICVLYIRMRVRSAGAQPITESAVRILIEIDDRGAATIDGKIPRPGGGSIPDVRRRPGEQILRPKIVARLAEVRSKAHDLIDFMLRRTLRVEVATVGRPGELIRIPAIKRSDPVVWPPGAMTTVYKRVW